MLLDFAWELDWEGWDFSFESSCQSSWESIKIPSNNSNDPYSCWFQWGEGGGGNL